MNVKTLSEMLTFSQTRPLRTLMGILLKT